MYQESNYPFDCFGYSFTHTADGWRGETVKGDKLGPFKTAEDAYRAAKVAFLAMTA